LKTHIEVLGREVESGKIPEPEYPKSHKDLFNSAEKLVELVGKLRVKLLRDNL
jgi:hypothetical protein